MMKFTVGVAVAVAAVVALSCSPASAARAPRWHELSAEYSYEQYLADLRKPTPSSAAELAMRKAIFQAELASVLAHNADKSKTWRRGINKFSDWTESEKKSLRGWSASLKQHAEAHGLAPPVKKYKLDARELPPRVDWREAVPPVLTTVKDQGQCGSCWAHAATETIETAWAQATGDLFVLSQQQIASCTWNPDDCGGTGGCEGGIAELAIVSVANMGGIGQEWSTPYTSYMGVDRNCSSLNIWQNLTKAYVTGYTAVDRNSGEAVLHALAFAGPLAISVDASAWGSYESGIFTGCDYKVNISQDHAVMAVGYGVDPVTSLQYVIVRNSWSAEWGEDGYIKLGIFVPGMAECGWNVDPQNGSGCKGQTAPQWSCGMCGVFFDTVYAVAAPNHPGN